MSDNVFLKDDQWKKIGGDACKIIDFIPNAKMINGKVIINNNEPYATVTFECTIIKQQSRGFICHKEDFEHLWKAFEEKMEEEEVIIFYVKDYLRGLAKIFSVFMPKFCVMVCPKEAFNIMKDHNYKPDLSGEARFLAQKPRLEWNAIK